MCDDSDFDRMTEYFRRTGLSRRQFGALSFGAALGSAVPAMANARELQGSDVDIRTPDGVCDAYFVHPAEGASPAVLMWPDIMGLRPAFRQMAERLAQSGYAVLVVNPFYRMKRAPTSPPHPDLDDPATRAAVMGMAAGLTAKTAATDANALIPWLGGQAGVDKNRRMASSGYCFGGPYTLFTAAAFPNRIRAVASFHGAPMVTDKPDSAHLLIQKINVHALIAIAETDDSKEPNVKTVLCEAFKRNHLSAEIEVYKGAPHGWCPIDSAAYNHDQAERAWTRQLVVFKRALA